MRVSYRWLMATLGGEEVPLEQLLESLTMAGLEVEGVSDLGIGTGKIVTARILTRDKHPNADNLSLCDVSAGAPDPYRIVCGAKNMGPQDLVPLALEGAVLPEGFTIKKSKIRGEASQGMMCSARELHWSDENEGLLILPPAEDPRSLYREGEPFDALIDVKITPNRPDCLSIFGIARDLAARQGRHPLTMQDLPGYQSPQESGEPASQGASVVVEAPQACPLYLGRIIRGVKIGPSPLWLRRAVESAGLRSINNVVDVTNYILIELGQPLHAFDLAKVSGSKVVVRHAGEGETVTTLDGQEVKLTATDLLIADPEKPIALAGIMGCGNTEISDATTDVFLECAYFHPATIRKTSKRLGKQTDSSYRFERGVDYGSLQNVVDRAAQLIAEVSGGAVAPGSLRVGQGPEAKPAIQLTAARVNALLGLNLSTEDVAAPLRALGFPLEVQDDVLQVQVPPHRPDVSRDADLVEEVARIRGYEEIPDILPRIESHASRQSPMTRLTDRLKDAFVADGAHEAYLFSFISEASHQRLGLPTEQAVHLVNPLSAEYAILRTSLLPGLLDSVSYNHNRGQLDVRLFEIGKVYCREKAGDAPREEVAFAVAVSGNAARQTWRSGARPADFFDGKAIAENLLQRIGVPVEAWQRCADDCAKNNWEVATLHPGKCAIALSGGVPVVAVGELHPRLKEELGLKRDAVLVFGRAPALLPYLDRIQQVKEAPVFPAVTRDLALVADKQVAAADIETTISRRAKSLLTGMRLFDVYEGERIGEGKRSLAYELRFSQPDRTLTDDEVNQTVERVLADLKAKLGVELRS